MGKRRFQLRPVKNQVRRKRRHLSLIVSIPQDRIHVFGMVVTSTNCVERVPEHETLEHSLPAPLNQGYLYHSLPQVFVKI